jgi:hypothetical protein
MALNSKAIANRLVSLLATCAGVSLARKGVPESQAGRLEADVTLGGQEMGRKAVGVTFRDCRFLVTFSYRTDRDESAAEDALMDAVDDFLAKVSADLTLSGTCSEASFDLSHGDAPEYQPRAGREYGEYPVVVIARQYGTFATNP